MKSIILTFVLLFASITFADECTYYSDVPTNIEQTLGTSLKGKASNEVIEALKEEFTLEIENFADVNSVEVSLKRFDGSNSVYLVVEEDDIWSAAGGSTYEVLVNAINGKIQVQTITCWQSGE